MDALLALAETQYGVVARSQAVAIGSTAGQVDRLLRSGRFRLLFPGVYAVSGAPRTGRQRAMAAALWLGDDAAISHLTGATMLRFDGCKTRELWVSVLRDVRRRTNDDIRIVRVLQLPSVDRVTIDGIPCTSATRTILDCASRLDREALEVAFESARRMGLTSPDFLARRAAELGVRAGASAIRELLSHQQPGERSLQYRLEVKTARLLRESALPRFERQYPLGTYRIDFARPELLFGIECEGFEYHGSRLQWKRDKKRTAWIEAQGWRLLFVTWDDVMLEPEQTLDRIRLAI
jgi:very-short-patch-repair endonuclease